MSFFDKLFPVVKKDSKGRPQVMTSKGARFTTKNFGGSQIILFDILGEMDKRARMAASGSAEYLGEYLREQLSGQDGRTGRVYKNRQVGEYRASRPGDSIEESEWPAEVSGKLVSSINVTPSMSQLRKKPKGGTHRVAVGSDETHAHFLVHGTRKMEPRNFLAKAYLDQQAILEAMMVNYTVTHSGDIISQGEELVNANDLI